MRTEPVGNCGCELIRDENGLRMVDCPVHAAAPDLLEACQEMLNLIDTNLVFPPPEGWETLTWGEKLDHPRSRIYDKMQAAIQSCRQDRGGIEK